MRRQLVLLLCLVALGAGLASCQKLVKPIPMKGELQLVEAPFVDAIPADYGDLISVTSNSANSSYVQLWFQKSDKSIVMVYADYDLKAIGPKALRIPRR